MFAQFFKKIFAQFFKKILAQFLTKTLAQFLTKTFAQFLTKIQTEPKWAELKILKKLIFKNSVLKLLRKLIKKLFENGKTENDPWCL